jgi:hypothetical protein
MSAHIIKMKTERLPISKVDIKNNKLPYGDHKVPDYMPALHPLVALFGSRGQGKTTRICEWLLMYDAAKSQGFCDLAYVYERPQDGLPERRALKFHN